MAYDESFDGTNFTILKREAQDKQASLVNKRKMPRGTTTYIDIGGALPRTRTYKIHLPDLTTYETLLAKAPKLGSLVDLLYGTRNAVLENVEWEDQGADASVTAQITITMA